MFCPTGVTWSPGAETGPMAQRVRKNKLFSADDGGSAAAAQGQSEAESGLEQKHRSPFL